MQWARLPDGSRIRAAKTIRDAVCPGCEAPVIPKCGDVVVHHWAHTVAENCDSWSEPETEWHRHWKDVLSDGQASLQEITCRNEATGVVEHRLDVMTPGGWAVEVQHSPISSGMVTERERYYTARFEKMAWVFDCRGKTERVQGQRTAGDLVLRWSRAPTWFRTVQVPAVMAFDEKLIVAYHSALHRTMVNVEVVTLPTTAEKVEQALQRATQYAQRDIYRREEKDAADAEEMARLTRSRRAAECERERLRAQHAQRAPELLDFIAPKPKKSPPQQTALPPKDHRPGAALRRAQARARALEEQKQEAAASDPLLQALDRLEAQLGPRVVGDVRQRLRRWDATRSAWVRGSGLTPSQYRWLLQIGKVHKVDLPRDLLHLEGAYRR